MAAETGQEESDYNDCRVADYSGQFVRDVKISGLARPIHILPTAEVLPLLALIVQAKSRFVRWRGGVPPGSGVPRAVRCKTPCIH